ncbi:4'-phosphopantetheinyl transferase family protein [Stutzerimonas azotifigens]|uniref:Enterobactin synthase component D n=1 Tax=Stutzerimonas azotifigens TaxID=291995 RepID=A0ABR5Z2R6_9GAMM|nr:4'-phosphopantetheinyl transferase superfamily protein [Stutzerimonas azotifigens]MBA1274482.1 4'-phosphopantetheinyl transferase superfamily protein [Stutzerimonas azotifigens]
MTTTPLPLPTCCTALSSDWPFPFPAEGARLVSMRFDPARLDHGDFGRCGIAPPRGVSKRQTEYLAGRLCAHEALRLTWGNGVMVKPNEDRSPAWPAGCVGSITHGGGWAGAVVAQASHWRGLGLDVERQLDVGRADRLMEEILTPAERQGYSTLSDTERALKVTLTFSLKESLFKALYPLVRTRFYFEHAELVHFSRDGSARLRLLTDLTPEWTRGAELDGQFVCFEDYLLSLVSIRAA